MTDSHFPICYRYTLSIIILCYTIKFFYFTDQFRWAVLYARTLQVRLLRLICCRFIYYIPDFLFKSIQSSFIIFLYSAGLSRRALLYFYMLQVHLEEDLYMAMHLMSTLDTLLCIAGSSRRAQLYCYTYRLQGKSSSTLLYIQAPGEEI